MKKIAITTVIFSALLLAGCGKKHHTPPHSNPHHPGVENPQMMDKEVILEKKVTPEQQVISLFGQPDSVDKKGRNREIWTYNDLPVDDVRKGGNLFVVRLFNEDANELNSMLKITLKNNVVDNVMASRS